MVRLVVAADGRNSVCRQAAQISTKSDTYPQTAITCTFRHQRLHDGISTEFHRPSGPLTAVPMPGHASSLVWVCNQREAETAMAVDDTSFIELLETRLQGLLGCINSVTTRTAFPLSAMHAEVHAKQRVVLVGEAGHVIPPIGAQGLNLGLRDCAALAECLTDARCRSDDVGGPTTLAAYNSGRRFDVWSRSGAVDILNRSLLSSFLPTHLTRGAGLHAMKHIAPLRRWAIEVGMAPAISRHLSLLQPGGGDLLRQRRHAN